MCPALFQVSIPDGADLENEFQAQLDGAVAARAKHGVKGGLVRGGTTATKTASACRWIGKGSLAITAGGAIRISEIGMIENIERLDAELGFETLPEFEILADGKIDVAEASVTEDVAAHGAKCAETIWNQNGAAIGVAAGKAERGARHQNEPARRFVLDNPASKDFLGRIVPLLRSVMPRYEAEKKARLEIAFGCTGGRHRSVTIADEIARCVKEFWPGEITVEHRDRDRPDERT